MENNGLRDAGRDASGSAVRDADAHGGVGGSGLSGCGMRVQPAASQRRSMLQRQLRVTEGGLQRDAPGGSSRTPALRKKHPEDLLLRDPSRSSGPSSSRDAGWALYPVEHAWVLAAVDGNYESVLEFVSADPQLLTRKDFISGYSVLHWLAKKGRDETLVKLLRYAERAGIPVNVNARGSGGLTALHVASMHRQYAIVKLLVGAFGADVDVMDYNGKRAWQYLTGDAPLEMKELLGTWDDEHSFGCARDVNNTFSAGAAARDEIDDVKQEVTSFDRRKRRGSWRLGSLRKLLPSFSFLGNKASG
ncbi:ankyrin repeat domain-containing protein SOWAHD [Brachionichthys hirsutus]|uniref:ankyrin repeat domain-containing protein SOWAHD n=1 Tax=Brachionichthys hirsutus TaxID=412623 RepID=UPI003604F0A5